MDEGNLESCVRFTMALTSMHLDQVLIVSSGSETYLCESFNFHVLGQSVHTLDVLPA